MNSDSEHTRPSLGLPVRSTSVRAWDSSALELEDDEPRQHLSIPRIILALLLVAGALVGAGLGIRTVGTKAVKLGPTWFAPYVDATLTPFYQFQDPSQNAARQSVLGFVVSAANAACTPSWGAAYSLDQASQTLSLDRRVSQLRNEGSGTIVSFGGAANTELAVDCKKPSALSAAYAIVIKRYRATTIDLDIEGAALSNWQSIQRRAAAIRVVQKVRRSAGAKLAVWLTLPVEPSGLQQDALSVVSAMLAHRVDVAGINVMAMDFGGPQSHMLDAVERALIATHHQLVDLYPRYGIHLNSEHVWNKLGATIMIGQNDTPGERVTVGDARRLVGFASKNGLARVSMWSINRDAQCGSSFAEVGVHSNTCSGVPQTTLEFTGVLSKLSGSASAAAGIATPSTISPAIVDNPATSPYPIWQASDPYETGYKVVREGNVYQAKWYSQGQDPAIQVQYASQTPWLLVGPVLPGDHAPTTTPLAPGTFPAWSAHATYNTGARVLFNGLPYRAKWYNQATSPAAQQADPSGSPWLPLFTIPGEPPTR